MEKIGQNNFKNGTDDLTHIVTKFPKKRLTTNLVQTYQNRFVAFGCVKINMRANFTFKIKIRKRHFKS
jgi:hypothetical protein